MLFTGRPILYAARSRILSHECENELRCTQVNGSDAVVTNQTIADWTEDPRAMAQVVTPWVHYVPVKEDLSDLLDKVRWVQAHREEAQQIADNALTYAQTYLSYDAAARHVANQLAAGPSMFSSTDC
eukprot:2295838-Prymnesium_polylepis.1